MREYLFRGKDYVSKKWIYSNGYYFDGTNYWFTLPNNKYKAIAFAKNKIIEIETLGQYVEATDVNKKEIFDGDKVAFSVFDFDGSDTQYTGVVVFSDGHWQIWEAKGCPYYGSDGGFDLYWVLAQDATLEIIGNVHEVQP